MSAHYTDIRTLMDRLDWLAESPAAGDILDLEFSDDVLAETVIDRITESGNYVVHADGASLKYIMETCDCQEMSESEMIEDDCRCDDDDQDLSEAKYQGREVPLNKPMKGDVAKSKVYVKNAKGNVIKVNFGQKGVKIKKNNPGRRKNFRARHNCSTAKDKTTARYWSCRAW